MAAIPEPLDSLLSRIYGSYEFAGSMLDPQVRARLGVPTPEEDRPHLGASIIGRKCARQIWLMWRWAKQNQFNGRMLRLFTTGHIEEIRLVADLRAAGVEVHERDPAGHQWRVSAVNGHFGGSMDGVALGIPEAPKTWHVLEFKTANDKTFSAMKKDGVEKTKTEHYAQMQCYMGLTGIDRAQYLMVNKNTDEIYAERVKFDENAFKRLLDRAESIIAANDPPLKISQDPSWYECKLCPFNEICHGTDLPRPTCRSCAHATPERDGDGRWSCAWYNRDLSVQDQRNGCENHRYIPSLLESIGTMVGVDNHESQNVTYQTPQGHEFVNGNGPGYFTSREIHAMEDKSLLEGDKVVSAMKLTFGAKVVSSGAAE